MPRYYHVTKVDKLHQIVATGLKVSSGVGGGGMSSDSNEAYKYAEQDRNLIYLWTDIDYTDRFKKEGEKYALIVVDVDTTFDDDHIDRTSMGKTANPTWTKTSPGVTTVVSNANIPIAKLFYYKTKVDYDNSVLTPLMAWGTFSMTLDRSDKRIWEGMSDDW